MPGQGPVLPFSFGSISGTFQVATTPISLPVIVSRPVDIVKSFTDTTPIVVTLTQPLNYFGFSAYDISVPLTVVVRNTNTGFQSIVTSLVGGAFMGSYNMISVDPGDQAFNQVSIQVSTAVAYRLDDFVGAVSAQQSPTNAPVPPPTQPPTNAPVASPTNAPVPPPTQPPTNAPVAPPTNAPVPPPTQPPTNAPVASPTNAPVPPPTQPPTNAPFPPPTQPPTNAPFAAPTVPPTLSPTNAPVTPPTAPPTNAPFPPPTQPPTNAPVQTASPTNAPTNAPVSGCSPFSLIGGVFPTGTYALADTSGPEAPPTYCFRLDNPGQNPVTFSCVAQNVKVSFDAVQGTIQVSGFVNGGVDVGTIRESNSLGSVQIIFDNVSITGSAPNFVLSSSSVSQGLIVFNNMVYQISALPGFESVRVANTGSGYRISGLFGRFDRFGNPVYNTNIYASVGICIP